MAVRCSAEQIADTVVLFGMTGRFNEYCENADDARELKSLDLIISTMDAFIEAFCFSFEDIYQKVNLTRSKKKFIEFLKPRCLLLTKDNSCFNFILVCAFVHDIIHSFSVYNKCFHLVKVASICLATILKNRFEKIFETDSAWEELMSFCIKIHDLVYPPGDINEYDDMQLVGDLTEEMAASFLNMARLGMANATDDSDEDSDTKTTGNKFSASLQNGLTTKSKVEESEDMSIFSTSTSVTPVTGEGTSLKSKSEEKIVDESKPSTDNTKDCVKYRALTDLTNFTNAINENMSIGKNVNEILEKNFISTSECYLAIQRDVEEENSKITIGNKAEGTENLCHVIGLKKHLNFSYEEETALKTAGGMSHLSNLKLDSSTGASHTYHTSGEDFSPEAGSEDNKVDVSSSNEGSESVSFPLLPDLAHKLAEISIEKKDIDNNLSSDKNLRQMNSYRKYSSLSSSENSSPHKETKKLSGSPNLRSSPSPDARPALQLKDEEFSLKNEMEDNEEPFDIRRVPADKVRSRITDNPQHLLEIMNLLKKCEENIDPNLFSPDEYDIPINDTHENEELETSYDISESFSKILEAIPFYQDVQIAIKMAKKYNYLDSFSDDEYPKKSSGNEASHEMGDEVAYVNRILESHDPLCPLCVRGKDNFFDACVYDFIIKYSKNNDVSDYFRVYLQEDSE